MANTAKAFLRTAHLVWTRARAADARKTNSEAIREAIPYIVAPIALFGAFEYLSPFVERTVRHTPLASANRPVDPKETAWKVELANRRAVRLHDELQTIKAQVALAASAEPAAGSMGAQLQSLQQQVQRLTDELHTLKRGQRSCENKYASPQHQNEK